MDTRVAGGGAAVGVEQGGVEEGGGGGQAVAARVQALDREALVADFLQVLPHRHAADPEAAREVGAGDHAVGAGLKQGLEDGEVGTGDGHGKG